VFSHDNRMRSLSALLIIGCVAASTVRLQDYSKEYRYRYSSHVLTGIPELNLQYAGLRLSSDVRIQLKQDSSFRIKLENPRFVSYNDMLPELEGNNHIRTEGKEEPLPSSMKSWLEKPFTLYHKRGLVEKLETENGEPEFIVNLKKGISSQLQADWAKFDTSRLQGKSQDNTEIEILPTFTSHEASVMGKCETIYSITKLPEHQIREFEEKEKTEGKACEGQGYYEILKTKNFDRCTEHPTYVRTFGVDPKSDGSGASTLPSHSSVTRMIVCGSRGDIILRKVVTENKIVSGGSDRMDTKESLQITSVSTLELVSVEPLREELSGPSSPEEYASLVYEYPSGSPSSSRSLKQETIGQGKQVGAHAPMPDLMSAPHLFIPRTNSERDVKQTVIELFTEIVEATEGMSESSQVKKDVAGLAVTASHSLHHLSYNGLKDLEETFKTQYGQDKYESIVEKAFYDLVATTGTNPCLMLIRDKVLSGEMSKAPASWSWILSNALRSVVYPTEELLGKLVELLKTEHIQNDRVIRAAYVMGLTDLVNKACLNPETMRTQFPYKIFGQTCSEQSSVIKTDLVPYLASKLKESSRLDTGSVITYISALGNLEIEEASKELLEVVEGRISISAHPRSVAVYKLIRAARENPSIYRPVFLSIIENSAEDPQVRMAAVTAITYCSPTTADLEKLAIRTWFEPSKQVAHYIYSTLNSLSRLSSSVPEYETIQSQAQTVLRMAKPSKEGIQYSHNLQAVKFIESLKSAVSHKLAYTVSEDSAYPRSIYTGAELKGLVGNSQFLETVFYMQGAEDVIDQIYELYSEIRGNGEAPELELAKNKREVEEKMSKLNIKGAEHEKPEAHFALKFFGLQKLWSVDEKFVNEVIRKVTSDMARYTSELERGMKMEYFKILDLSGAEYAFPTESGMPAYISIHNPTVAYSSAELKSKWETSTSPSIDAKIKAVTNYKRRFVAGVIYPVDGKFFTAGVDTSMHIATPVESRIAYRNGQIEITMKPTEEPEYQKEMPVIRYDNLPFTAVTKVVSKESIIPGSEVKTIKSHQPEIERSVSFKNTVGIDLKMTGRTEESGMDVYKFWEDLKVHVPSFMASLPLPHSSAKRTTVTISYNPQTSEVKEINFYLGVDTGIKKTKESMVTGPQYSTEEKIEKICSEFAAQDLASCTQQMEEKLKNVDTDIIEECEETKEYKKKQYSSKQQQSIKMHQQQQKISQKYQQQQSLQMQQQQGQQQLFPGLVDDLTEECLVRKQLCKEEYQLCLTKKTEEGQSSTEARNECGKIHEMCELQQKSQKSLKESLAKLENGNAVSIASGIILRGREESEDRKIETHLTVGEKMEKGKKEQTQVSIKMAVKTPALRKPFYAEIHANAKVQRPNKKWDLEEILKEDLTSKVLIHGDYGLKGEEKKSVKATILAIRSDKQVRFVRESEDYRRCTREESEGRKLTVSCKETRHHAASLDKVHTELAIPRSVATNRIVEMTSEALKALYLPYMSQRSIERQTNGQEEIYEIEAGVDGEGKTLSVMVSGNGEEVKVENLRLGAAAKGLLPICTRYNLAHRVLQKLTNYNSPSSCTIEGGKVETFDRFEYGYALNDCEHIVFTEATPRPRITVSAKETPQQQTVTMVVDGHKYELDIKKESRYSRDNKAVIKVNGEVKEFKTIEEKEHLKSKHIFVEHSYNVYDDLDTYVTSYEDGVYKISSKKYGVSVLADGKRMELKSYQNNLRNRVAGLCGDLNGERYADLKSSEQCITSRPKIAALTFMLENGQCRGLTTEEKTSIRSEQERCVRKQMVPTKVSKIYRIEAETRSHPEMMHLVEESKDKLCFSKELIRTCVRSFPKEVKTSKVEFTCRSGPKAEILKKRVQAGELITELKTYPTTYTQTVYQPKKC